MQDPQPAGETPPKPRKQKRQRAPAVSGAEPTALPSQVPDPVPVEAAERPALPAPPTRRELEATLKESQAHVETLKMQLARVEAQVAYQEVRYGALATARDKDLAIERKRVTELSSELLRLTTDLAAILEGRAPQPPAVARYAAATLVAFRRLPARISAGLQILRGKDAKP